MRDLHFTQYEKELTAKIDTGTASWPDIVQFLMDFKFIEEKEGNKLFNGTHWIDESSPDAVIKENKYGKRYYSRCQDNILGADILTIDFDNKGSGRDSMVFALDQVKEEFKDYEYVCYTSYNHQNPLKDDGVDKFRIVLPFSEYCPKAQWLGRVESFKARFAHLNPDEASFKLAQGMYVPIMHPSRKDFAIAWHNTGKCFDWSELEYLSPAQVKKIQYTQTKSNVSSSEHKLYPDSILETANGSIRMGDVTKKVSGVKCPFHGDNSPTEFIEINTFTGRPFFHCKKCKTVHMSTEDESDDPTVGPVLKLKTKNPSTGSKSLELIKRAKAQVNSVDDLLDFGDEVDCSNITIVRDATRYVEQADKLLNFGDAELVFIRAPKGTGKTTALKRWVKEYKAVGKTVFLLGHRIYLLRYLGGEIEADHYHDVKDEITDAYAMSIDSLFKLDPDTDKPRDLVIIDEVEQVLQHIISKTFEDKRSVVFRNLQWLLKTAKRMVCLDADLTPEMTIDIISWLRNAGEEEKAYGYINGWMDNRTVEMYDSKNHLLALLMEDVAAGKNVYVPVGSRTFAEDIRTLLSFVEVNGQPVKTLCLTSTTNTTDEALAFIKNPTVESQKYQVIVASPTVSTGVSLDAIGKVHHFEAVYGFFNNRVYTYQDCDQAISRVRNREALVRVWIQSSDFKDSPTESELREDAKGREIETRRIALHGEKINLTEAEELYVKIFARIKFLQAEWMTNKREKFTFMKQQNGFTVIDVEHDKKVAATGKSILDIIDEVDDNRDARAIHAADDMDAAEYNMYKGDKNIGRDLKLAVRKYELRNWVVAERELTVDVIVDVEKNGLMSQSAKQRNAITNLNVLVKRDKKEREVGAGMPTDSHHRALEAGGLYEVCQVVGIDFKQVMLDQHELVQFKKAVLDAEKNSGNGSRKHRETVKEYKEATERLTFEISDSRIDALSNYVSLNLKGVNKAFGTRFRKPTDSDTKVKVWNGIFKPYGFGLKRVRVMVDGVKSAKHVIDCNDLLAEKALHIIQQVEVDNVPDNRFGASVEAPAVKFEKPKRSVI